MIHAIQITGKMFFLSTYISYNTKILESSEIVVLTRPQSLGKKLGEVVDKPRWLRSQSEGLDS